MAYTKCLETSWHFGKDIEKKWFTYIVRHTRYIDILKTICRFYKSMNLKTLYYCWSWNNTAKYFFTDFETLRARDIIQRVIYLPSIHFLFVFFCLSVLVPHIEMISGHCCLCAHSWWCSKYHMGVKVKSVSAASTTNALKTTIPWSLVCSLKTVQSLTLHMTHTVPPGVIPENWVWINPWTLLDVPFSPPRL